MGALLLVWTGDRNFGFIVPWLVFGGTVLFVLEPRLSRRSGGAHQAAASRRRCGRLRRWSYSESPYTAATSGQVSAS